MNSKKLFLITGLALFTTLFLTIVAFRLAEPNSNPNAAPNALASYASEDTDKYSQNKEESLHEELYLSKKGEKLIYQKLVRPISNKFGIKISVNQFSRCPSGVDYYQITSPSEQTPYFFMQLSYQDGCAATDLCQFRVSLEQTSIEVWNEEKELFMTPEEYVAQMEREDLEYQMEVEPTENLPDESPAQKTI